MILTNKRHPALHGHSIKMEMELSFEIWILTDLINQEKNFWESGQLPIIVCPIFYSIEYI